MTAASAEPNSGETDRSRTLAAFNAVHLDAVDSTNEAAKRMVLSGKLAAPAFVLAREQSSGRGSRGRKWVSPRDAGIYVSLVLAPPASGSGGPGRAAGSPADLNLTTLTLAAGVASVEAIAETTGIRVQLKPVNDLYADGGKLGGILTETVIEQGRVKAVVIGLGINVHAADRPVDDSATRPVCLEELDVRMLGREDVDRLLAGLVGRCYETAMTVLTGNGSAIRERWEHYKMPGTTLADA